MIAVDVGGTCTDCVVFRAGEPIRLGKALSTPPDFADGVIDAVRAAADDMSLDTAELLQRTRLFLHGSTVVDNTIFTASGAMTGLITTAGFEDTLIITRGAYGRWSGQPEEMIKHPTATDRPPPLVPRARIFGVRERVDYKGAVIDPLIDSDVAAAVDRLVDQGVRAIAVCLLWSFRNPVHERRVREIIVARAPSLHVSISAEIAPVPGEFERSSTTVINAYAGEVTKSYLDLLALRLQGAGYRGPILVMQGNGGLVPVEEASVRAVGLIECGPAAGVVGARHLGRLLGDADVIAADMGGTTFKVGVIQNGELDYAREPIVNRYHYVAPKLEIVSIGSGGGSIVSVDPRTRRPKIGPASAGARPGPVCYGLGGAEPTLTDVAAIIGYMDPTTFLGGAIPLDIARARAVFAAKVAQPMGLDVEEAAIGIYRIAAAQIADLVRAVTVERGLDPRDFVLHAFGGSCGLFAGAFAKDLAVRRVVVPFTASVNCAYGMVAADVLHDDARVHPMAMPADPEAVNRLLAPMREAALRRLANEGFAPERIALEWSVDLRYRRQVHQVMTPLAPPPVTVQTLEALAVAFERVYERRYGRGSAYRAAGIELVTFRLAARGLMTRPDPVPEPLASADPAAAQRGERKIFVDGDLSLRAAGIYDFARLRAGNVVNGPAVVHTPITTIVIQSAQIGRLDEYRNLIVEAA